MGGDEDGGRTNICVEKFVLVQVYSECDISILFVMAKCSRAGYHLITYRVHLQPYLFLILLLNNFAL